MRDPTDSKDDKPKTADHSTSDFKGMSETQKDDIRQYRDGLGVATDYCRPYFDKGVRYMKLMDGIRPKELDGSFSRVMLNIPMQIIQDEIPRTLKGINTTEFFDLDPLHVSMEQHSAEAKKWLEFQMKNVQKINVTIVPTAQSAFALGNGYRVYSHRYKKRVENKRVPDEVVAGVPISFKDVETNPEYQSIITGQYAGFFSILPQPGGSMPNMVDDSSEDVIDGAHWITHMTKERLETNVKKHGWDGPMVQRLLGSTGNDDSTDPVEEFLKNLPDTTRGGTYGNMDKWMTTSQDQKKNVTRRYQVGWFFMRDRWVAVGAGRYVLWAGKPLIDAIPISNHRAIPMLDNWFGKSMIGLSEDLIISIMQNFNARLDYLAQTLHPSTYIPTSLLDHHMGDKSVFDPKPYSVIDYPNNINIATDLLHDRYPDLPRQAFLEEGTMNQLMQKVLGQPDSMSGQGTGSQADGSATGFMGLLSQGNIRSMQRALNFESTGIADDLWLTLKYGAKYVDEDTQVRMTGLGGSPWYNIAHEAITDGYGIRVSGIQSLDLKEETYRKMLSIAQFIVNNPTVENQKGVIKQMMQSSEAFTNEDELIGNVGETAQPILGDQAGAGQGPIQNETRSAANRNEVEPNTGSLVPAGELLV